MDSSMQITDLVENLDVLKFNIEPIEKTRISTSPEFVMYGSAIFQVQITEMGQENCRYCSSSPMTAFYVRFFNRPKSAVRYTVRFSSNALEIEGMIFTSDDGTWCLVKRADELFSLIDVEAKLDIARDEGPFRSLYDDTELTDFKMNGEDGSVLVHRAVLAASSPVLRRMLSVDWKETKEGEVKVHATNKNSLELLKAYMYLNTIPKTGADLEQLLLLSKIYEMPDLERRCVFELVINMTGETVCHLMEFATQHKVSRLTLAILNCVQKGAINISQILEHV